MKISTAKTIQEDLIIEKITVFRTKNRDVDSVNLEISYNDNHIGHGHLNNRTNFAHITIDTELMTEEDECELEGILVEGIENRTIALS